MLARVVVVALMFGATVAPDLSASCDAPLEPLGTVSVQWIRGPVEDRAALRRWCRGVGPPLYVPNPAAVAPSPPALDDLVILTWNAHLAEGRVSDLVTDLRSGALTAGVPVRRFVLLVQELYRRGPAVPWFEPGARAAHAIRGREREAPDASDYASTLGLALLYVPSMRNGAELFEDRGNAILSTEPLSNAVGLELPFERQRRVAVAASIDVMRDGVASSLRVLSTHLEPLSAPQSLWIFRNPRRRQVEAIVSFLSASRFEDDVAWAGTVLGGDFNTVQGGVDEAAYRRARSWGYSTRDEDRRTTHLLGRLDFLFFRLAEGWTGSSARVADKFGSDHHPVIGRLTR